MTVKEFVDVGVDILLPLYAKEEAKSLLWMVLESLCHCPMHSYYSDPDRILPADTLTGLKRALADLERGRPVQYVLGKVFFEGCTIGVREGVLIPRPETAELVRWAKSVLSGAPTILDAGTGSGAIAVALAKAFPQAKVFGVDVSEEALEVAKENSRVNGVAIDFLRADLLQAPDERCLVPHSFDLIISNPPYIRMSEKRYMRTNVLDYEPHMALFVPDEDPLLFYRALADWGAVLLTAGGLLMVEVNEQMGGEIRELFVCKGFSSVEVREDVNGKVRMVGGSYLFPQAPKCSS